MAGFIVFAINDYPGGNIPIPGSTSFANFVEVIISASSTVPSPIALPPVRFSIRPNSTLWTRIGKAGAGSNDFGFTDNGVEALVDDLVRENTKVVTTGGDFDAFFAASPRNLRVLAKIFQEQRNLP